MLPFGKADRVQLRVFQPPSAAGVSPNPNSLLVKTTSCLVAKVAEGQWKVQRNGGSWELVLEPAAVKLVADWQAHASAHLAHVGAK